MDLSLNDFVFISRQMLIIDKLIFVQSVYRLQKQRLSQLSNT